MYSNSMLKAFADATQSLKLYRRAELRDDSTYIPLIEKLYVDPLPNGAILETMLRPNTTLIIGRKGTGKSTVFQRAQHEVRKKKTHLSAYVDIKTVYETAEVDSGTLEKLSASLIAAGNTDIQKLALYRSFAKAVFSEIQTEIKKQIEASWIGRTKERITSSRSEVIESLSRLIDDAFDQSYMDVSALARLDVSVGSEDAFKSSNTSQQRVAAEVNVDKIGLTLGATHQRQQNAEHRRTTGEDYSKILLRTFSINAAMERLLDLLSRIDVKHLYIFIDDFSELPEEAMNIFVDSILAPLNNWSNETIKFKIAAYPGRIYLGKIDLTKIDEIHLDTFRLYGSTDISTMEEKAIDFTRRLLSNRFDHYANIDFSSFCEGDINEIYRHLFFASSGNARNLGHILFNLQEAHAGYGKRIGIRAISEASRKYYEEKIEPYFGIQKFAHESFHERSSIFSLKELLETIAARAKELRTYKESSVTRLIEGRTPSSHFHIISEMDTLLATLELNFFITKYYEMKDRDGRKVSVYALNHGLCSKHTIPFGRPSGRREFRLYYVERIFDNTPILKKYIEDNQELRCGTCGAVHGLDKLDSIKLFNMMCPACREGQCEVINLSKKYASVIHGMREEMLLPATELGILNVLFTEDSDMYASDIASELDCSFQLVGRRGKILSERGLVDRAKNNRNRRVFSITDTARTQYFTDNRDRKLQLPED